MKKTVKTIWEVISYDVWGNSEDGWDVNASFARGEVEINCKVERNNAGTPSEFLAAYPSFCQIQKVFGLGKTTIKVGGDDMYIYVNRFRDDYPIGEMHCVSHQSLSPIIEKEQ